MAPYLNDPVVDEVRKHLGVKGPKYLPGFDKVIAGVRLIIGDYGAIETVQHVWSQDIYPLVEDAAKQVDDGGKRPDGYWGGVAKTKFDNFVKDPQGGAAPRIDKWQDALSGSALINGGFPSSFQLVLTSIDTFVIGIAQAVQDLVEGLRDAVKDFEIPGLGGGGAPPVPPVALSGIPGFDSVADLFAAFTKAVTRLIEAAVKAIREQNIAGDNIFAAASRLEDLPSPEAEIANPRAWSVTRQS